MQREVQETKSLQSCGGLLGLKIHLRIQTKLNEYEANFVKVEAHDKPLSYLISNLLK